MASFVYDAYRNAALGLTTTIAATVDLDTNTIKSLFTDDSDLAGGVHVSTYVFVSELAAGEDPTYAAPHETIGTKTIGVANSSAAGTFDAADSVFDGSQLLSSAQALDSYVLYKDTGAAATSPNLIRFDSTGATGLPLTPNGASVTVVYNTNGIFRF